MTSITIIPFENIPEELINKIKNKIKEKFNTNTKIIKNQPLPSARKRGPQLLADDFIPTITKLSKDYGLGITNHDLYVPELNFVFGVALGKKCLISIARLKGDKLTEILSSREGKTNLEKNARRPSIFDRTIKEAVHELGHCFGLTHCPNPKCVIHFSNSLLDTDYKEDSFCKKCKNMLNRKILNNKDTFNKIK